MVCQETTCPTSSTSDTNYESLHKRAPLDETPNSWVMIGRKYQNSATTCMSSNMLEGRSDPELSFSHEKADMKRFLLCCQG